MVTFFVAVAAVLTISALCSLTEAALYAVRMPYIRQLTEGGSTAGRLLTTFKQNMEQPISAVLILNTAANTAGAAVAGAQARLLFGETALVWFAVFFTLSVLFFAEIVPKVAGVAYNRTVARLVSIPLNVTIKALYPLVWLSQWASRFLRKDSEGPIAPEDEVRQFAALSAEEGSILPVEAALVRNVLRLNDVAARDIMTPRTVVFKIQANKTVRDVLEEVGQVPHSRIPVYAPDDPENWLGVVLRSDILTCLARDDFGVSLQSLAAPLGFVPESLRGHHLLNEFLKRREHLLGVIDEFGAVVGIVTLEDVMESLIGEEIVDETDEVVDMQEAARRRGAKKMGTARPNDQSTAPDGPI